MGIPTFLRPAILAAAVALGAGSVVLSQRPEPTRQPAPAPQADASDAIDRPTSAPYTGNLDIFEGEKRAENLQIDRVMDLLGIKAGTRVADVGAGSGWFSVRAAHRAGETGTVYAVDINQEYVDHIAKRAKDEKLPSIRPILGREDDPLLPKASVDAVMILKTYHEFSEPLPVMRHVREALAPGGRVGIIDRNGKGDDHGVDEKAVVAELGRAGFRLVGSYDFVKPDGMDYFLIFEADSPRPQAPAPRRP